MAEHDYTALLNIEPGGGKTVLATAAALESGSSVNMIIGPDGTFESAWLPTVKSMAGVPVRRIGRSTKAQKEALSDFEWGVPGWYFQTPQFLTRADVSEWYADMLIVDEGHMLNAAKSAGQRKLSGYDVEEDGTPFAQQSGRRMFLSGTPWRNHFGRSWATMRFLWPHLNGIDEVATESHYLWLKERMTFQEVYTSQRDRFGRAKKAKVWLAEKEPGRLINEAPCVIQHFRRERCCDFHPNGFMPTEKPQELEVIVPLTPKQKSAIEQMEEEYLAWFDGEPLRADLTITQKQRIRQICLGEPKVEVEHYVDANGDEKTRSLVSFEDDCKSPLLDRVIEKMQEFEDEPVVMFIESQQFAAVTVARLKKAGISAFEYSGATRKERDSNLARFGSDFQVAVIVISAGGTGLDGIQRVTTTEFWLERSVDPTLNTQAEARADRMGAEGRIQRFTFKDDLGYADGRISEQLEQVMALRQTLRVAS